MVMSFKENGIYGKTVYITLTAITKVDGVLYGIDLDGNMIPIDCIDNFTVGEFND